MNKRVEKQESKMHCFVTQKQATAIDVKIEADETNDLSSSSSARRFDEQILVKYDNT